MAAKKTDQKQNNTLTFIPEKNQLLELTITDLGNEGEGIGKYEGFTFFVKGALPGDRMADFLVIIDPETGRIIADQRTLPRTDAHDW